MIKNPNLTKKFVRNIPSIGRIGQEGHGHKQRIQLFLGRYVLDMLRGIISHFVSDPTLIFRTNITHEYKSEARIGWTALYMVHNEKYTAQQNI